MPNTKIHLPVHHSLTGSGEKGRKVKILTKLPILFLAGPIRNAPRWHSDAMRIVLQKDAPVFIASPARHVEDDLFEFVEKDREEYETFPRQRAWEQYYMYTAAEDGCILFWFPQEELPKKHAEKVYAHISMVELGKWIERKKIFPQTRLVIGTDGSFPEWDTIRFEIETELPGLPVYYSLKETVEAALTLAMG